MAADPEDEERAMTGEDWTMRVRMSVSGDQLPAHAVLVDGSVSVTGVGRVPLHGQHPSSSAYTQAARRALADLSGALRRLERPMHVQATRGMSAGQQAVGA
jgi:hypothetical protein